MTKYRVPLLDGRVVVMSGYDRHHAAQRAADEFSAVADILRTVEAREAGR